MRRWCRERRRRQEAEAHVRQRLLDDYLEGLAAGDRDTLDVSRDYYGNEAGSWWLQVGATAYVVVLVVLVVHLGVFFSVLKALTS